MRRIVYHVSYNGRLAEWVVMSRGRRVGSGFNTEITFDTKKPAVDWARTAAKNEDLPSKLKVERKKSVGLSEESNYD